jgi:DNA-binding NarL/FixJ family response regulator
MTTSALALIAAQPDSLRYSLQALLARLPLITDVMSVEETRSLFAALAAQEPLLLVLDVSLTGKETGQVLELIRLTAPRTHSIVLVDQIEQQQALQATSAELVLLKGYPAADLFARLERLLAQDEQGGDK